MKSAPLTFPVKVLDQHAVVLGKTGAGKSSALRHMVEHLLAHGKRVCVVDPKGDWWGLQVGADGKSAGFPVILFGDFKNERAGDVPLTDRGGAHLAELVATGNRPCVVGMRGWTTAAMHRFWIAFAETLFKHNAGEFYLVIDEAHNFAPKGKVLSPQAGESLHWTNRLLSEGRGLGLVCLIASQRPQKVHNDTLTSCETLVAMRVVHAADRAAVEDWVKGADPQVGKEVLGELAKMQRGEAYVWSPEIGFGPDRLTFPMFTTFDSFAPPQLQKKVGQQGWASVNLDDVRERLNEVIEEAERRDPAKLLARAERAERERDRLGRELEQALGERPEAEVRPVDFPVLREEDLEPLRELVARYENAAARVLELDGQVSSEVARIATHIKTGLDAAPQLPPRLALSRDPGPPPAHRLEPRPHPERRAAHKGGPPEHAGGAEPLTPTAQSFIDTLQHYQHRSRVQLCITTGYSPKSGGVNSALALLRRLELIEGPESKLSLTAAGDARANRSVMPKRGKELLDYWTRHPSMSPTASCFLSTLYERRGPMARADLCDKCGYSAKSGGVNSALALLRKMEFITGTESALEISKEFYE